MRPNACLAGVRRILSACAIAAAIGSVSLHGQTNSCASDTRWEGLIRRHIERYPAMEIPDLYKLLHQATMGSEHAIEDPGVAGEWLTRELASLGDGPRLNP